jgi:hypothetical protein
MSQHRFVRCVALLLALSAASVARAAVQQSVETDIAPAGPLVGDPYTPTFASGGSSSTDILAGKLPTSSSGNFTLEGSAGLSALTNGSVATFYGNGTGNTNHSAYATAGDGGGSGTTVTYSLGGAFNISSIVIYGGWNDAGRDAQHYDLQVSTNGGGTFTTLSTVDINPGVQGVDITPVSNRVAFTDDALPNLATSVTTVRLNFLAVENGYTGHTEIDVFGTQLSVPGDADRNGVVNINDFNLISDNFLKVPSAPGQQGDVNFDNIIDQKDFREYRVAAGQGATGANTSVPEPAAAALASVCCLAGLHAVRRRK